MSEQPSFNPKWELAKLKVAGAISKVLRIPELPAKVNNQVNYKLLVSESEHQQELRKAEAFAGEVLDFFAQNTGTKLASLRPSGEQLRMFNFLLESVDQGSLIRKKTEIAVDWSRRPVIEMRYENSKGYISGEEHRFVICGVTWGVKEPYPHRLTVSGIENLSSIDELSFIALPIKPKSSQEAQEVLKVREKTQGEVSKVDVFSHGDRITIDTEGSSNGKDYSATEQYFFIGAFDGEETGRTYWLYGSNSAHNRYTESVRVGEGVFTPAYQPVQNK